MNFVQPDRVAVDLGGHRSSGIQAIAYARLRDHLGLPKRPPRVYDVPQQLAIIDDDVLDRCGVDCIELGRGFNQDEADWQEWVLPDGTECLIPRWVRMVREGNKWVIKLDKRPKVVAFERLLGELPLGSQSAIESRTPLACRGSLAARDGTKPVAIRGCWSAKGVIWSRE
jgi:hypothetical protein